MALTLEAIKKALKGENPAQAFLDLHTTDVEEEVDGLKKKNSELLGKVKEKDSEIKTLKKDNETLTEEKETLSEKVSGKNTDVDVAVEKAVKKATEKHKKELEEKDGEIGKLKGQLETDVIDRELTAALVKAKVQPALIEGAKGRIKSQFKGEVGDNDGKPFAKFDGETVDKVVGKWAQSDEGKHYVGADSNNGGGSNGTNNSGKAANGGSERKTMSRSEFDALTPADKVKTSTEGVTLTD